MKKSLLPVAIAVALAVSSPLSFADSSSTAVGGSGGAGGSAAGGSATGGVATGGVATNSNNTSGVSNASGGQGGTAQGGYSAATGGNVGTVSTGGSSASLGDVTVNYNVPGSPMGKAGLGVGVDPTSGHIVTENSVSYSGSYKLKNTPDINVGGPASGPCNGFSGGLGFSMAGLSIGGNASTVDEGCTARETARVAAMIGRMDIANAVLENLPAVQAALRAKAIREAVLNGQPSTTSTTTMPLRPSPTQDADPKAKASQQMASKAEAESREAALRAQQNAAQEALGRQATMAKVYDTLKFTDAESQGRDKTPQQIMAEEANAKLAAKAGEVKTADTSAALGLPVPQQVSNTEEVKKADTNAALGVPTPQQVSYTGEVKKADTNAALGVPALQQVSYTEEVKTTVPNAVATPVLQQLSKWDNAQAKTTALPPQEIIRGEPASKSTDFKSALTLPAAEDRIKAAKAAMNLQ
jgi:hypothetical protein